MRTNRLRLCLAGAAFSLRLGRGRGEEPSASLVERTASLQNLCRY
jgi:hypothetical protein